MRTLIKGGRIVNEGRSFEGAVIIEDEKIIDVIEGNEIPQDSTFTSVVDAKGCCVLPGIIDTHVHFREPGMTEKADIESESRAAAAGGVTSYFEMPNTVPQTTTLEALEDKFQRAAKSSHVNYTFFFGATNDNVDLFSKLDVHRIPGIKLFMGSSTGNMLVDRDEALNRIFASAKLPIMAHCEDTAIINRNMEEAKKAWGDDPQVSLHALIRSEEACVVSTTKAVALAKKHRARLHVAHVSTAEELELIGGNVTAEATVGHLYFTMLDHERLGARIKVNPAIKSPVDQFMLRESLNDGRITTIATDHAPHLLSQKQGGCAKAASGMPMVQFSLPTMLELVDQKVLSIERMVQLMAHNPATLFEVRNRGFIRKGYQADLVIVRPKSSWTVTPEVIESKCGWSPMEGHTFNWRVEQTFCNGHSVYHNGIVDPQYIGQPLAFR
jgi:dihydroorotase